MPSLDGWEIPGRVVHTDAVLVRRLLWIELLNMHAHEFSGSCTVTPNGASITVCNISEGFEVYNAPAGEFQFALTIEDEEPAMVLPVIYAHSGRMILCGSRVGKVRLWDSRGGEHIQCLRHEGMC